MWRKHIRYINYSVVDYWVVIFMLFLQHFIQIGQVVQIHFFTLG